MKFHDILLPRFIEVFAHGRPEFINSCVVTMSGREVRHLDSEFARQKFLIRNCRLSLAEFEVFNNFFRGRRGQSFAFRLRDRADYKVSKQFIANGEHGGQEFFLFKTYHDDISPYYRKITKPVKDSVKLYLNDQEVNAEVNYHNGQVKLTQPLLASQILVADFIFDIPVRFASDNFEYVTCKDGSIELAPIELIEVLE